MKRTENFFILTAFILFLGSVWKVPDIIYFLEPSLMSRSVFVESIPEIVVKDAGLVLILFLAGIPLSKNIFGDLGFFGRFFTSVATTSLFLGFVVFLGSMIAGKSYLFFTPIRFIFSLMMVFLTGKILNYVGGRDG